MSCESLSVTIVLLFLCITGIFRLLFIFRQNPDVREVRMFCLV